jgi:hypothetical protein
MIEYHEIDLMKSTLIAAPALALAVAQMDFFEKGAKDFQVLKNPIFEPLLLCDSFHSHACNAYSAPSRDSNIYNRTSVPFHNRAVA